MDAIVHLGVRASQGEEQERRAGLIKLYGIFGSAVNGISASLTRVHARVAAIRGAVGARRGLADFHVGGRRGRVGRLPERHPQPARALVQLADVAHAREGVPLRPLLVPGVARVAERALAALLALRVPIVGPELAHA